MHKTPPIEIQKMFFFPICNKVEIERIFDVKNGADFLLKLRAETIVDHMRLFRVYRNKALIQESSWSLEQSFDSTHYKTYLSALSKENRARCNAITYGNMFSNEPNGTIFQSPYGPIITISESLIHFLEFAHLAILDFDSEVPMHIRANGLRIAIRVMLKTEALDFFMDPRGMLPKTISGIIRAPIQSQMEFIAGHEFSHYLLGHISTNNVSNIPVFHAITRKDKEYKPLSAYSQSQQQEFEADEKAIEFINDNETHRNDILEGALLWFACLSLYETVSNALCLENPCYPSTHPSAADRFSNLLKRAPKFGKLDISKWESLMHTVDGYKRFLLNDVSVNIEGYENYGSVYLDAPNTKWRGRELVDRKDYY